MNGHLPPTTRAKRTAKIAADSLRALRSMLFAVGTSLATFALAADMRDHHDGAHAQTAWGIPGDPHAVTRTVQIRMLDSMRFEPAALQVRAGETIRLVAVNAGRLPHELVLGNKAELERHAALMRKSAAMEHGDHSGVQVSPGAKAEMVWNFNRPGNVLFACLFPGHYEAGMVGRIKVGR